MSPQNKKPVIIGNGYIGSNFVKHFNEIGQEYELISRKYINYLDFINIPFIVSKGDIIINCAGVTGKNTIDDCEEMRAEAFWVNSYLPHQLALECKKQNKTFVHISTGCVFGGSDTVKNLYSIYSVPDLTEGVYRETKLLAEELLKNTSSWVFRIRMPFNGEKNKRNWLCKLMKYDKILPGLNSLTHVDLFCSRVWEIVSNPSLHPTTVHAVEDGVADVEYVANILKDYNLKKEFTVWQSEDFDLKHIKRSTAILNNTCYFALLPPNTPKPNLKELIEQSIQQLSKQ